MDELQKNDIVQITDENNEWFACLLIVDEVKTWGIQGYIKIPRSGLSYYRIENGKFEKVGKAIFISE